MSDEYQSKGAKVCHSIVKVLNIVLTIVCAIGAIVFFVWLAQSLMN